MESTFKKMTALLSVLLAGALLTATAVAQLGASHEDGWRHHDLFRTINQNSSHISVTNYFWSYIFYQHSESFLQFGTLVVRVGDGSIDSFYCDRFRTYIP